MSTTAILILWSLAAYLIGAIPFGLVLGLFRGKDVRQHGSGNFGATNVTRVLGAFSGRLVFALDFLKGYIPAWITQAIFQTHLSGDTSATTSLTALMIIAAIFLPFLGHLFPVFLGFRGGKGVATMAGLLGALAPIVFLIVLLAFALVFLTSRIISLASLTAALLMPLPFIMITLGMTREGSQPVIDWLHLGALPILSTSPPAYTLGVTLCGILIIFKHRTNIQRLRAGTELSFKK